MAEDVEPLRFHCPRLSKERAQLLVRLRGVDSRPLTLYGSLKIPGRLEI